MHEKRSHPEEDDHLKPAPKRARSANRLKETNETDTKKEETGIAGKQNSTKSDGKNGEPRRRRPSSRNGMAEPRRSERNERSEYSRSRSPRKRAKLDDDAQVAGPAASTSSRSPRASSAVQSSNNTVPAPRSPPRQRKRPGGASRISHADREAAKHRQQQREHELAALAKVEAAARGVQDVVKQHYNAQPERGREWRRTDSKIKGLRSFNNWVKSVLVHKFSPNEDFMPRDPRSYPNRGTDDERDGRDERGILVLDIGCGKGGDLQKWHLAPQTVDLYVGLDPAEISITQAKERYDEMVKRNRPGHNYRGPPRSRNRKLFHAELSAKDCFGEWIGDVPIVQEVGIDPSVGPDGNSMQQRWGSGGFDVVSMMFCMHYAFENEVKARRMLKNVAGSLRKGGRFFGVIPNSDILSAKVEELHQAQKNGKPEADDDDWDPEKPAMDTPPPETAAEDDAAEKVLEWGNSIYRVKFPGKTPSDGVFRPPFGWKYFYFLEEAIAEIPEYVVPWEAFRAYV